MAYTYAVEPRGDLASQRIAELLGQRVEEDTMVDVSCRGESDPRSVYRVTWAQLKIIVNSEHREHVRVLWKSPEMAKFEVGIPKWLRSQQKATRARKVGARATRARKHIQQGVRS